MKMIRNDYLNVAIAAKRKYLRQFGRDEDGSIIVLTLLLFVVMLVLGGMAVDFMRFEERRANLQSVADRAVLAAAELDQTLDGEAVVRDFFAKEGLANTITNVDANTLGGTRVVSVTSELDVSTFYLGLIGIEKLDAPAASRAIEGVSNVEISMVLDISGSMRFGVPGTGRSRMELLQQAATNFVNRMLTRENRNRVSISLVNYSQHVNIGADIFNALNTGPSVINDPDGETFTNTAYCVDLPESAYSTAALDLNATYLQTETYQFRSFLQNQPGQSNRIATHDQPVCPNQNFEAIIPFSQNAFELNAAIANLQPRQFTSIYRGMKWGVTLLDPSFQSVIARIPSVDPEFARQGRPASYTAPVSPALGTEKFIILLTDGRNQQGRRVNLARGFYDTARQRNFWASYNHPYTRVRANAGTNPTFGSHRNALFGNAAGVPNVDQMTRGDYNNGQGNRLLQNICTAAKQTGGIEIFTIAMGNVSDGEIQMRQCATNPGNAFVTTGADGELNDIFDAIANQISELRLSL